MMLIFFKKVEILALPQKLYKDVRRESEEWKQFVFSIKKNTPIVFYVTRKKSVNSFIIFLFIESVGKWPFEGAGSLE